MINGAHVLIYAEDAEKVRAFFRDVLSFPSVDAGHGWLIFALPPAELGIHPAEADGHGHHVLHLMCDDVKTTVEDLKRKGVEFAHDIRDDGYGLVTALKIPGGGLVGLYQPRHPTALGLAGGASAGGGKAG